MTQINETTQGVLDQISEGFDQNGAYNLQPEWCFHLPWGQ